MECDELSAKQRRKKTIDKYNASHIEENRARKKAWFDANPEYLKTHYAANRPMYLWKMAKHRAKRDSLDFDIEISDIVIPEVCPVLGIIIRLDARGGFNPNSASLDRIIPELGYVKGNICVISNRANLIKRDATLRELEAVTNYVRRMTTNGP